ncbi:hypothetical protein [Streptomyces sp. NPDC058145]|uniref:hypothetical protein n=1 Tax=Streptomyces sp. NPDC058145 TaxID=3346356 RepID=UPI0036E6E1E6
MTTATTVAGRPLSGWSRDAHHGTWYALLPARPGDHALGALRVDRALLAPEGTRERLAAVVLATARLRLPGLLGTVDLVAEAGEIWLLTARPPAPALVDVLSADGPRPDAGSAASVLNETAQTLLALHAAGLSHGSLGPDTVLLTPDGIALLTEAGLGTVLGDAAALPASDGPPQAHRQAVDTAAWAALARTLGTAWTRPGTPAADLLARCSAIAESEGLAAARAALVAGRAALPADILHRTPLRAATAAATPRLAPPPNAPASPAEAAPDVPESAHPPKTPTAPGAAAPDFPAHLPKASAPSAVAAPKVMEGPHPPKASTAQTAAAPAHPPKAPAPSAVAAPEVLEGTRSPKAPTALAAAPPAPPAHPPKAPALSAAAAPHASAPAPRPKAPEPSAPMRPEGPVPAADRHPAPAVADSAARQAASEGPVPAADRHSAPAVADSAARQAASEGPVPAADRHPAPAVADSAAREGVPGSPAPARPPAAHPSAAAEQLTTVGRAHRPADRDIRATVLGRRNRVASPPGAVAAGEDSGEILLRFGPGIPVEEHDDLRARWQTATTGPRRPRRGRRGWIAGTAVLAIAAVLLWLLRPDPAPTVLAVRVQAPAGPLHCGQTADLVGVVTTDGRGGPVTYRWLRADGQDSGELVRTAHRGERRVRLHLRWTVRGPGRFRGTARLSIAHQRTEMEAKGSFTYACP